MMHRHDKDTTSHRREPLRKVLLMGNPNVGKSVIFNRLSGLETVTANYSGTTVGYHEGLIRHQGRQALLIDVPGVYGLKANSEAEAVAVDMLKGGADLIVCVLDATHLERNLHLAFDLQAYGIPIIYVLNLSDVAQRRGIRIDSEQLSEHLRAPVYVTVAVRNEGIGRLKEAIFSYDEPPVATAPDDPLGKSEDIAGRVVTEHDVRPSFLERFGDSCIKPKTGLPIMFLVLAAAVGIIVGGGMALRSLILLPLVNNYYIPFITHLFEGWLPESVFRNVLIGEYGVLIKMVEWPFALILPYVFLFFVVFSFLEDSGYLPRLGVLMDGVFRKIGLPGSNIIPFVIGYGCAVPAILGTRAAGSRRERIIVATLIAIAVPCTAQTGAFIVLLGDRSVFALVFVYLVSLTAIALSGILMNKVLKGRSRPLILEIPNLLIPHGKTLRRKITLKLKHFIKEAQGPMFIGILLAALLAETGLLVVVGRALEPLVVGWLDLPADASLSLILGIVRRELAVMPLLEMDLTTVQLITGSVVALFYLPCISVFFILVKEFGARISLAIAVSTFLIAFFFGGLIQLLLNVVM